MESQRIYYHVKFYKNIIFLSYKYVIKFMKNVVIVKLKIHSLELYTLATMLTAIIQEIMKLYSCQCHVNAYKTKISIRFCIYPDFVDMPNGKLCRTNMSS